jgi:lon-related putative ATP-dependent protease
LTVNAQNPVPPELLRRICPADGFEFETTEDLEPLTTAPGQDRALEALDFGVAIERRGYNLFAIGSRDLDPERIVMQFLERAGKARSTEQIRDWVYVNNFDDGRRPNAISLPPGQGRKFRKDMDQLVEDLEVAIQTALESDECRARHHELEQSFAEEEQEPFEALRKRAEKGQVALLRTPSGISLAPMKDGEVMEPEMFNDLPEEERERIQESIEELQKEVEEIVHQIPRWRREFRRRLKKLNREIIEAAVRALIDEVRTRFENESEVCSYLDDVFENVLDNSQAFQAAAGQQDGPQLPLPIPGLALQMDNDDGDPFLAYRVNLLVDREDAESASVPVVLEENPTFGNLVGRIEHMSEMGSLSTDFTLIRAGALHRANGGFLVVDARLLLMEPFAWEGLKRALHAGHVRIESLDQAYGWANTVSLEPEPIPINVKVVLIGERLLYYLLTLHDPDFGKLFRIAADFDSDVPRTPENSQLYARLIAEIARREELMPFSPVGVARVIEEAARLAQHSDKLTLHFDTLQQLLEEADHWAKKENASSVDADHVETAIDKRRRRHGQWRERSLELITEDTILIDTSGEAVGQINGLSVLSLGDSTFGQPIRISVRTRPGGSGVVDIEREAKLGGKLHSKGVLILTGYLAGKFRLEGKLSLSASLVFEQTYGGVDGDSASSAELYALLSSLSGVPIKQSLAVTGSVNQHGQVQTIGGVNEKIEGFFEVCQERGLTGKQGVLIPESNVKHLMLRTDVVKACAGETFRVYPVKTIEEGIEILTGVSADEIFGKVEDTLRRFAKAAEPYEKKKSTDEDEVDDETEPEPEES